MRIWSFHPRYLDSRGLVALWREALLARKVLRGLTKGYRHHPQLERFRARADPLGTIEYYLSKVLEEGVRRGFAFDSRKIPKAPARRRMTVAACQLQLEWKLLKDKLRKRDKKTYLRVKDIEFPDPHPLFSIREGRIEAWERAR